MRDALGRSISYLRLSVTKACSMRCIYCRPGDLQKVEPGELLSPTELENLVRHLVRGHGLSKVRLTGGEPTSRTDLLEIIHRLAEVEGLREVVMTTNGLTLAKQATALKAAGLARVNVSLDSLNPERYEQITGVKGLGRVLAGIDAAITAGLKPKLNTVVVRGENDHELDSLLLYAMARGLEIRFIELMPMGPLADKWQERYVPESEMRRQLGDLVTTWRPMLRTNDPARRYKVGLPYGRRGVVGFITAMSCPFCDQCNRVRIGADGTLYPCLMDQPTGNLLPALRPSFNAQLLERLLAEGLQRKAPEHPQTGAAVMTHIGG